MPCTYTFQDGKKCNGTGNTEKSRTKHTGIKNCPYNTDMEHFLSNLTLGTSLDQR